MWLVPNHANIVAKYKSLVSLCSYFHDGSLALSFTLWPSPASGSSHYVGQTALTLLTLTPRYSGKWESCFVRSSYGRRRRRTPEAPGFPYLLLSLAPLVYVPVPEPVVVEVGRTCWLAYINQGPPPRARGDVPHSDSKRMGKDCFLKGDLGSCSQEGGVCWATNSCLLQEL